MLEGLIYQRLSCNSKLQKSSTTNASLAGMISLLRNMTTSNQQLYSQGRQPTSCHWEKSCTHPSLGRNSRLQEDQMTKLRVF